VHRPAAASALLALALPGLVVGGVLALTGQEATADVVWSAVTVAGLVTAVGWVVQAARDRRLAADVVAVLAEAGTLLVGEPLAGALIALMLASGRVLEDRAAGRARRELTALLARAPRVAHRRHDGGVADVEVGAVVRGDRLVVRAGEVVPVDGVLLGPAVLDEAALTGEPLPVTRGEGDPVRSGVVNAGDPVDVLATGNAEESTYAGIVRLVREAEAASSPAVRTADRYAAFFLVAAIGLAALAGLWSGDPVRAVAVLVVATPCPLILAVPVAIVAGVSRAAGRGVLVKGGAALEQLAGGEVLLFDKTGTLTQGHPEVAEVVAAPDRHADDVLGLAAAIDQLSSHVLAAAVVREARRRALALPLPTDVHEQPGRGVEGLVEGRRVAVGSIAWLAPGPLPSWARVVRRRADLDGALTMAVTVDGALAGAVVLDDPIRPDAGRTLRGLRAAGFGHIAMVTGDRADVAETIGAVLGIDEVLAERSPEEKVTAVGEARQRGSTVMVGDGINDAPALARADVGVALGATGAGASSEAADVVLTVDRLDRLGEAVLLARRTRRIATQSAVAGIGLSVVAMGLAAAGLLPPTWGALAQEAIDVAVIVNALRALRPVPGVRLSAADEALTRRFQEEHHALSPELERLRLAADDLTPGTRPVDLTAATEVHRWLVDELLPHEVAEDRELYPALAASLGGNDPTGVMSRGHAEIAHLTRRLGQLLAEVDPATPDDEVLADLRRVLYGLQAVLRLHFAQEEEAYFSLADGASA